MLRWWPAVGPALLAALLSARTLLGEGLAPAIGLSVAGVLVGVAIVAPRREWWTAPLLLIGPISLIASPAGTELSFNLSRPGDAGWFWLTVAIAASVGLCLAAALAVVVDHPAARRGASVVALVGAVGFALALTAVDPQPDLGRDLTSAERAAAPTVQLVNFAYGLPESALVVDVDGTARLTAHMVNDSDLPHTFTIDELGLDVYVPAGRATYVDVAVERSGPFEVLCTIGDHRSLGMVTTVG